MNKPIRKNALHLGAFYLTNKLFFTLLLLVSPFVLPEMFGQEKVCYLSSETGETVGYASVFIRSGSEVVFSGMVAEDGKFAINLSVFSKSDTLLITHFSFTDTKISLETLAHHPDTIVLHFRANYLQEIVVKPHDHSSYREGKIGSKKWKEGAWRAGINGSRVARYINSEKYDTAWGKNLNILFGAQSLGAHPVRVSLFSAPDGLNSPPVDSLLIKALYVGLSPENGGWLHIDLSNEDLAITEKGLYVVIDWLPSENLKIYEIQTAKSTCNVKVSHAVLAMEHVKVKDAAYWHKSGISDVWRQPKLPDFVKIESQYRTAHPIVYFDVWHK